jgi:hypothetical protein
MKGIAVGKWDIVVFTIIFINISWMGPVVLGSFSLGLKFVTKVRKSS